MIKSILVPIDFSDVTEAVLSAASEFAKAFHAKIVLTHVALVKHIAAGLEVCPDAVNASVAEQLGEANRRLHEYEKALLANGLDVTVMLDSGPPSQRVAEEAALLKPDLVILGSHCHGALRHLFMGSVRRNVLRNAECPVVSIPANGR